LNNRQKMRMSNNRTVYYLNKLGYTDIVLRTHCRHKDVVNNLNRKYRCTDYWNLFDGMMFDRNGEIVFIQIKTNNWAPEKPIRDFLAFRKVRVMSICVTNKYGKWQVLTRDIKYEG